MDILKELKKERAKIDSHNKIAEGKLREQVERRVKLLDCLMEELSKLNKVGIISKLDLQEGVKDKTYPYPNINMQSKTRKLSIACNLEGTKFLVGERLRERKELSTLEDVYRYVIKHFA